MSEKFEIKKKEPKYDPTNKGERFLNVKEVVIGDGKVRIKDGAIIISDGTNDRIIIGYYPGLF